MTKRERVLAALEGRMDSVDRPPVSVWFHLGTAFLDGRRAAEIQVSVFQHYDFDFLKAMNDYPWPMPAGMESVETPEDLDRFGQLSLEAPAFREQLALLGRATQLAGRDVPVIDTIFNPFGTARRTLKHRMAALMREAPDRLLRWLDVCAENMARYVRATARAGAAGVFFSINGAERNLSSEDYERFVRPFDLRVLQAAREVGPLVVGHVHGPTLDLQRVLGYPVAALNWSHLHDNDSIASVRQRWKGCIIGGVDEIGTSHLTPKQIVSSVREAAREAAGGGFMVGPGCAVPTDTAPELIRAARRAADELGAGSAPGLTGPSGR